jgi:signal transduction histidine kinase
VQILGEDGAIQVTESECSDSEKDSLAKEAISRFLSSPTSPTIFSQVIGTGKSRLVRGMTDAAYESIPMSHDASDLAKRLGVTSVMVSPLFLRGRVMGAISLSSFDPEKRYDERDLSLHEELARRASIAVENARLFQEAQEAISARDEFLSIASHELKTPLTSLSLQLQILMRSFQKSISEMKATGVGDIDTVPVSVKLVKSVEGCEKQSNKLTSLLDELMDLTRIRIGKMQLDRENVDLAAIVTEVANRFKAEATQRGAAISVQSAPSTVGVWDRVRIEQIASNLISNALKYGEGKPISIFVENDVPNRKAKLVVKDQGLGISEEMQEKIFERFERAGVSGKKISGLGLGLYITRQIVEAHGGSIKVDSKVGNGSVFTVDLPLDTEVKTSAPPRGNKEKVG